jgi:methenyltetrahydrofolate cyclohydrolase
MSSRTIGAVSAPSFLDAPLGDLLDRFSDGHPNPGGGSAAGLTVALAAAVVTMTARVSDGHWEGAGGALAQAKRLRARTAPLAETDAVAYAQALAALHGPRGGYTDARNSELAVALERAAEVPLAIAESAADVAELAATLAEHGNPNVRGDTAAAAVLAEAGARAAAKLVEINLTMSEDDPWVRRARQGAEAAADAARRALASATSAK